MFNLDKHDLKRMIEKKEKVNWRSIIIILNV